MKISLMERRPPLNHRPNRIGVKAVRELFSNRTATCYSWLRRPIEPSRPTVQWTGGLWQPVIMRGELGMRKSICAAALLLAPVAGFAQPAGAREAFLKV